MRKIKERSYFFDGCSGISVMITFHNGHLSSAEVTRPCDARHWHINRDDGAWQVPEYWPERPTILNILKFMEQKEARYE